VETTADARKEKINADQAWEMIQTCRLVHVAKGKSVLSFEPDNKNREEILKAAIGRSGALRAPAIRKNDVMWIGFNEGIYSTAQ
jgi:hypothetical protein